jgi:hypothetical protein
MTFASTTAFIGIGNRASLNLHFHGANGRIAARIDINENPDGFSGIFTESWDEHIDAFLRQYLSYWKIDVTLPNFSLYDTCRIWFGSVAATAEKQWGPTLSQEIVSFIKALVETLDAYTPFEYGCEQFEAICRLMMQINQENGSELEFRVKESYKI